MCGIRSPSCRLAANPANSQGRESFTRDSGRLAPGLPGSCSRANVIEKHAYPMRQYPRLRPDLTASEFRESDGTETVILKEPVSERFFRLSLFEYDLLTMLDGTVSVEEALQRLKARGLYYSSQEAQTIVTRAAQFGLLLGTQVHTAKNMLDLKERMHKAKSAQRVSSYYFFSLPLLNPDNFLSRTVWIFRLLCNKWTGCLLAIAAPIALYLIVAGFPRLQREYLFFFNLHNLLCLWAMIVLTKLVHEFSHAYTAKSFGLHVPQMGVALLLFLPCLFCNTTDAWQLADRRQRMAISAAGILAEAVLAVIATFIWYFSKPGIINSLAFYLMTISMVSTIIFNANPLIKFDGYFILMDYLQIPNLSTKAMDHIRYLFMNRVLGMTQQTSPANAPRELIIFTVYGICAFIYRVSLYTGIAAGVYLPIRQIVGHHACGSRGGGFCGQTSGARTQDPGATEKGSKAKTRGRCRVPDHGGRVRQFTLPVMARKFRVPLLRDSGQRAEDHGSPESACQGSICPRRKHRKRRRHSLHLGHVSAGTLSGRRAGGQRHREQGNSIVPLE